MLPKRQRLSRREFEVLLKKGRRIHGDHASLVILPAAETKCGVVVSKKTARRATARNLMRRRVFSILRDTLPSIAPKHIAVLTRPSAVTLDFDALHDDLRALLVKV